MARPLLLFIQKEASSSMNVSKALTTSLFTLGSVFSACTGQLIDHSSNQRTGTHESAIIQGDLDNGHPAVGQLLTIVTKTDGTYSVSYGTASLIGDGLILTAAHSAPPEVGGDIQQVETYFRIDKRDENGNYVTEVDEKGEEKIVQDFINVSEFTSYPSYQEPEGGVTTGDDIGSSTHIGSDIAVAKIDYQPANIAPLEIAGARPGEGEKVTIVGYGETGETPMIFNDTTSYQENLFNQPKMQGENFIGQMDGMDLRLGGISSDPLAFGASGIGSGDSGGPILNEQGQIVGIMARANSDNTNYFDAALLGPVSDWIGGHQELARDEAQKAQQEASSSEQEQEDSVDPGEEAEQADDLTDEDAEEADIFDEEDPGEAEASAEEDAQEGDDSQDYCEDCDSSDDTYDDSEESEDDGSSGWEEYSSKSPVTISHTTSTRAIWKLDDLLESKLSGGCSIGPSGSTQDECFFFLGVVAVLRVFRGRSSRGANRGQR
jgi:hypothetical protein